MIKTVKLKFGSAPGVEPKQIDITPVTLFVGPNNSGKSKILREIRSLCIEGLPNMSDVILDTIKFEGVSQEEAQSRTEKITLVPEPDERINQNYIIIGKGAFRTQVEKSGFIQWLQNPGENLHLFCTRYLSFNTLSLDGANRINLVNQQSAGDLQYPQSSLQVLFATDEKRLEVRRIIYEAFSFYFVIDPTLLGQLRIRLSNVNPASHILERGLHDEAIDFHSKAQLIEVMSDGVKAFTGIITEVIAGDPKVLLIDEPEAFLHPSLSFKLGKEIAKSSVGTEKRLFVSTHSPNFVMGCIQSGAPINIVRLTYRNGAATARLLQNEDILKLMRNPLLRSTGVLSGLFYEFVVVTESDTDRAFYQEINDRLLVSKPEWGIPNCLFINAQNKQTVQTIIRPLRELGIPAVGIIDIDVLKEGGSVWSNLLSSAFIPQISHEHLSSIRLAIKRKLEESGKDMKRDGGIEILENAEKEAANNLFDQLVQYGVFVVRKGELESWLKDLGSTGHGPNWLVNIFTKMGEDPNSSEYLTPSDNDVWQFIGFIKNWFFDANRKGIPN